MMIFSLDPASGLAEAVAQELGEPLSPHEHRRFSDGEHKIRPLVDPRGADVYIIQSLHGDLVDSPHDRLCQLLMFAATLREHGAGQVTAVIPYMAYARKDRQTQPHDPVSQRHVALLLEAVKIDQVIALEVHNVAAFQNAFRCPTQHVSTHLLFQQVMRDLDVDRAIVVASPDPGGVKRAQLLRETLETQMGQHVGFAMVDKRRKEGVLSESHLVAGEVRHRTVVLFDDLIASGETMSRAAVALRQAGASRVIACAAHGLFVEPASQELLNEHISQVVVTDSIPSFRLPLDSPVVDKLRVVSAAPLLSAAMGQSHGAWRGN